MVFIFWKKEKKPTPRKTVPVKAGSQQQKENFQQQQKENFEEQQKENFQSSSTTRVYPTWTAPSIIFPTTPLDSAYEEYKSMFLEPSAEIIAKINALPPTPPVLSPNPGSLIANFDANVSAIPWDADNKDSTQPDIVWGHVSRNVSKSLFMKAYHASVLTDPSFITSTKDENNPMALQYSSILLDMGTRDPAIGALLQTFDMSVLIAGQALQPHISESIHKIIGTESTVSGFLEKRRAEAANKARQEKIAKGLALTVDELADEAEYNAKKGKLTLFERIVKFVESFSVATKLKTGFGKAKIAIQAAGALIKDMSKVFISRVIPKFMAGAIQSSGVALGIQAGFVALNIATAGAMTLVVMAVIAACSVLNTLNTLTLSISIALMPIIPVIFEKAFENGSFCKQGKSFDMLIPNQTAMFFFTMFVPFGMIVESLGPYMCVSDSGEISVKSPFALPDYFYDTTLSLYKHFYPKDKAPSPQVTKIVSNTTKLGPEWKEVAGIYRKDCEDGTTTSSPVDALCNIDTYCPKVDPKKSKVPATTPKSTQIPATTARDTKIATYSKPGGNLFASCDPGDTDWTIFPLCTAKNCDKVSRENGNASFSYVAGVCWRSCGSDEKEVGALCRKKCPEGWREVAGVCWKDCTANQVDVGALCRDACGKGDFANYPYDVAGICWEGCGDRQDMGALCRDKCRPGFHDVGCCWGNRGTYAREMVIPTAMAETSGGYSPGDIPSLLSHYTALEPNNPMHYCDFSLPLMLDRMGQFYYNQSVINPQTLEDGRIKYEYFIMFYCVIASSELSCDVGGCMRTVTFDPITGANYEEEYGTIYPEDPGNTVSYRRFYFLRMDRNTNIATINPSSGTVNLSLTDGPPLKAGDPVHVSDSTKAANNFTAVVKSIDANKNIVLDKIANINGSFSSATSYYVTDGEGTFSVTGCTNTDYTAPDAQVRSTDEGVDPPISLPKVWKSVNRTLRPGQGVSGLSMAGAIAVGGTQLALGGIGTAIGGRAGAAGSLVGGVAGGVGGGFAGIAMTEAIQKLNNSVSLGNYVENSVAKDENGNFYVSSETDNWSINFGPIYEVVANRKIGYVPDLEFCANVNTTALLCSHQFILRDTVNDYQAANPTVHVKTLYTVEPRGKDGCYYKWSTTSYDPATNLEGTVTNVEEVVRKYEIKDKSTCVWTPTNTFIKDMKDYPIRQYFDSVKKMMIYPTKTINYISNYSGRWIRIRPSLTAGDSFMEISQIAVYDPTGKNIALNKPCYTTSTYGGPDGLAAPVNIITNGILAASSGISSIYKNAGNSTDYISIDLGQNYNIYTVEYYGRIDSTNSSRNKGVRIQILYTSGDTTPIVELTTSDTTSVQAVQFTTPILTNVIPSSPFTIPQTLPKEVNLNGCAVRCSDRPVIDSLVSQYNTKNTSNQITNVLRAATPFSNRCDYEIEMKRTSGSRTTIGKEVITMTTGGAPSSEDGTIYGRYIRLRPNSTYLCVSQIVVSNTTVENLAKGKPVYASSSYYDPASNTRYASPSVITDGTTSSRSVPNVWQSGYMGTSPTSDFITRYNANEYLDIDLGQSTPITSISYYGGSDTNNLRIQVLATNETLAVPLYETTIRSRVSGFTFKKCAITLESYVSNPITSFIQQNTPYLSATDTSGGVLTFKSVTTNIMNFVNSIINPIKDANPLGVLNRNVTTAKMSLTNTLTSLAENQVLNGCPDVKCSDTAVLNAIASAYNLANHKTTGAGMETNTMLEVAKAGQSSPNTCDVLFKDLYSYYDDYLYDPLDTQNTLIAKRFTLVNTGGCVMQVAPGASIVDISANATGIITTSGLTTPYTVNPCQVNCRDKTITDSVKVALEKQNTATVLSTFRNITQSFMSDSLTCEYMMSKDITTKDTTQNKFSTDTGIDTYVRASFTADATCKFTVNTVKEYDPDVITSQINPTTNLLDTFLNGVRVQLPYLFTYDNTSPSKRVNETVQIL